MKFAFIENRYKTIFWAGIAGRLSVKGHRSIWLAQNPVFAPQGDNVYLIPFPQRKEHFSADEEMLEPLSKVKLADRFVNYFGGNDRHYHHYLFAIKKWLDLEKPDVVIGESTLFHELLVIEECRARRIPYFHPSMPGYPGGRYSIYAYDTKDPVGQCQDIPDEKFCLALAEAIRNRERIPDYMIAPTEHDPERTHPLPRSIKDRLTISHGYLLGERFNTPSPWRKWLLDRKVRRCLEKWKTLEVQTERLKDLRYVLYPLQMQPEANLDVWGQKFRNQVKLISQIADNLPVGWHLLVKANPKAKYEVSTDLLAVLECHPKVSPISLTDSMSDILQRVDLVTTVTGTIATECMLSGKPVVQFGPGIVENGTGCFQLTNVADIKRVLRSIEAGNFSVASESERIRLVKRLYQTTFPGKVSDPVNSPAVMAEDNLEKVADTLLEVAKKCV